MQPPDASMHWPLIQLLSGARSIATAAPMSSGWPTRPSAVIDAMCLFTSGLSRTIHHGGTMKPNLIIATWLDCKKAGPLLVSLDHRGTADGKPLRVYFSNVAVRLAGSSTWMEAH